MSFEHKENRGSLFRNKDKDGPKHPDFTGSANVNGATLRIAGWNEESKNGKKYLSLAFSEPQNGSGSSPDKVQAPVEDDFPF